MEKILEGELARFHVPDVLTFLNMCRRTGLLVMERDVQETKLFFRDGSPVYAHSSKAELRLGNMLVRQGKVKQEVLERALSKQRGHRIGQALLSEKILSEGELASFLKVQVSEVIFETFEWGQGLFTFWEGIDPPLTAVTLEMDLQNLLMEGARRNDERGRIAEAFPDLDVIVEAVTNPERIKRSVTFTPDEWKVFFLVDGRRTLAEICRLAGSADDLTTLQILHNLMTANFVALGKKGAPAADDADASAPNQTVKVVDGRPVLPPPVPVSVEFAPAAAPPAKKADDDTREVVTPDAVNYLADARQITVSRLVLLKDGEETSFPLMRDSYTVGRHRNNDIVISDPKVSSFHARIDRSPEGFLLVDLKSRNGSFVNARRIESAVLKTGDEIRMGTARLVYKVDYTTPV